jgi:hypothetical protein
LASGNAARLIKVSRGTVFSKGETGMVERRRHQRFEIQAPARLLANWQNVVRCTATNLSKGGACVQLDDDVPVPDQVDLFVKEPVVEEACRVVWRAGARLGLCFRKTST